MGTITIAYLQSAISTSTKEILGDASHQAAARSISQLSKPPLRAPQLAPHQGLVGYPTASAVGTSLLLTLQQAAHSDVIGGKLLSCLVLLP